MTSADPEKETGSTPPLDLSGLSDLSFGPAWGSPLGTSPRPRPAHREDREGAGKRSGQPRDRRARSGPRRENRDHREGRDSGGRGARERDRGARRQTFERFEPSVRMAIYAEDAPFEILAESIRASLKTYEIFDIARIILDKPDRFVVVLSSLQDGGKLYESVADGMPFSTEEAALAHAAQVALPLWFSIEEKEVDAPKGDFQSVMRCPRSGTLLPPTSHHLFSSQLTEAHRHHGGSLPVEVYRRNLETVREPEVIAAWLESMKKRTIYVLREEKRPEGGEAVTFETAEMAKAYLCGQVRSEILREWTDLRVAGPRALQTVDADIRRSVEWYLERQKYFPLDTANYLRSKLRRHHLAIFKKGKKGVTFVSAVKRKPLPSDAVFNPGLARIIETLRAGCNKITALRDAFLEGVEAENSDTVLKQLAVDLKWLKTEGYVLEYSNGTLELQAPAQDKRNTAEAGEAPGDAAAESPDQDETISIEEKNTKQEEQS